MRGAAAERAQAGQRCALNLTGADLEAVARGDWVLHEAIHAPTRRIDARVAVLAAEEHALEHWTPVHVHLATADVTARISISRGGAIAPGTSDVAQLTLDKAVGALHGDRFILRDQSARRTLGGGVIIDPFAHAGRRATAARKSELAALASGPPETVISELIKCQKQGVDLARFERVFNLKPERAGKLYAGAGIMALGKETRLGIPSAVHDELRARIPETVREFHSKQPQAVGIELSQLREQLAPTLPLEVFQVLARGLADERRLQINGSVVRLPGHDATANPEDERMWQTLQPVLEAGGANPPVVPELAQKLKLKEPALKDFLHRKSRTGEVMRIKPDRFYLRSTVASLAATAQALAQKNPGGTFTAAQYRDAIGVGRGLAIEILEFLDSQAITQRVGDARKMRKDYAAVLGAAEPLMPPARPHSNVASDKRR
jgi:selenocysteine-specific elongation factor